MPEPRDRRHLQVHQKPKTTGYKPHPLPVREKEIPAPTDPVAHAKRLMQALESAAKSAQARRQQLGLQISDAETGTYLEFESPPDIALKLESLENRAGRQRIELLTVRTHDDRTQSAVVFVPDQRTDHFSVKVQQYASEKTPTGARKNKRLIERIADISSATVESLWTDDPGRFPSDPRARAWWEVWLRRSRDGREYERFLEFAGALSITTSARRLQFEDRVVLLAKASVDQLSRALDALGDVAELRGVAVGAAPFDVMDGPEQAEWTKELEGRLVPPGDDAPAVCILDTGVNLGHRLLRNMLAAQDAHAVEPQWGAQDHHKDGHGTAMAGLAVYGDLSGALASTSQIRPRHRLESVKVLPPHGANEEALYGTITATAASIVETEAPRRARCFSMAVTAKELTRDGPSPTRSRPPVGSS